MRFPEFKGEWKLCKINNKAEINPKSEKISNEFFYIDLESVEKGCLLSTQKIAKTNAPSRARRHLNYDDVIFQCVRPYQRNNFHFLIRNNEQYICSTGYAQLRANENPSFLYHLLESNKVNNQVMLRCTGTSYPAISSEDLGNIMTFFPDELEQRKIGCFLDSLDKRINVQRKIIEDLLRLKKGLIDSFFTSADCPLSSMIEESSERANQSYSNYEVYSVSNSDGFIKQTDQFGGKEIASLNKSNYKIVGKRMFAYNPARINVGSIARNEENKPVIVSPMYVVFSPKQSISPAYLECFFKSSFFSKQMKSRLEGSVRQCLTFDGLSSIPIKKFSTNEQQNFINLVCKLKNVEQIESQILEKFKEGKNYLLNSLFI